MAKVTKPVSFNSQKHAVLLARIEQLPPGAFSPVVRDALRAYFELGSGVTLALVYQELQAIKRRLDNGAVVVTSGSVEDESGGDTLSADILGAFK